jgi:hypothetical protein
MIVFSLATIQGFPVIIMFLTRITAVCPLYGPLGISMTKKEGKLNNSRKKSRFPEWEAALSCLVEQMLCYIRLKATTFHSHGMTGYRKCRYNSLYSG